MEEMWERREKKERRRDVIKGYKTGGGEVKSKIEEIILKRVGVEEVRKVKREKGARGFAVVNFRTEREKREVRKKRVEA